MRRISLIEELRKLMLSTMAGLMIISGSATSGALLFAPAAASANGNNGTIKIHEAGTPSKTNSNDPKVCSFNIEGFGFDPGQTGVLVFTVQGGGSQNGVVPPNVAFGPVKANGYYATQYLSLQNGRYKVTLYGKDEGGQPNLQDKKAKSKVFTVYCAPVVVQSVGSTTAAVNCGQGGLLIHFINGSSIPVAKWLVNGVAVVPDANNNYLYPVAEAATYNVAVTADGRVAGDYTGTLDCSHQVVIEKISLCHKTSSDSNEYGLIQVAESAVGTHLANGDVYPTNGACPSSPAPGRGGSDGSVLGESITPPTQTVTSSVTPGSGGSVLGTSTTNLPVTGGSGAVPLLVAFFGAIGAYWVTRRQMMRQS